MDAPIAIDIVLLPREEDMEEIIRLNAELQRQSGVISHPLNAESCLPHISLNMCGIRTSALPLLESRVRAVTERQPALQIPASLRAKPLPDGQIISELAIDPTAPENQPIIDLHEACLATTEGIELQELSLNAYVQSHDLNAEQVQWTTSFRHSVRENGYHPHLTMNIGNLERTFDMMIVCDRIALCQLGNYCTCRKLLMEHTFPSA